MDYANLRLQVENKSENIKTLKGTGPENLKNPKSITPKAIMDPKHMIFRLDFKFQILE